MPHNPTIPEVAPNRIQPIANTAEGTKVATAITPSRDSQDERHCEKARHARSGRPRWNTEEASPPAARANAVPSAATPNQGLAGSSSNGTPTPTRNSSANPAPDAVVKKTIEKVGCMVRYRDSRRSTQRSSGLATSSPAGARAVTGAGAN